MGLCDFLVSFMGAPILQGCPQMSGGGVFLVAVLSLFHYSMVLLVSLCLDHIAR